MFLGFTLVIGVYMYIYIYILFFASITQDKSEHIYIFLGGGLVVGIQMIHDT